MKYVVKLFPEIIVKSRQVRTRLVKQLRQNLRNMLSKIDPEIRLIGNWDRIEVKTSSDDEALCDQVESCLMQTPGITFSWRVEAIQFNELDDIVPAMLDAYREQVNGKTFRVSVKRVGKHDFNSMDVERFLAGEIFKNCQPAGVNLKAPEVNVQVDIVHDQANVVTRYLPGVGGYPLGSQNAVMSLISGGYDSTVSSYLTMRRGLRTHFCFFNLGGSAHEIGVKQVAHYIWQKYGSSHRVRFFSVPFEPVVAEILKNVDNAYMGVILKRMMLKAASRIAENLGVEALVTGESLAQVSSQTLTNLSMIDSVTDCLVLRPLVTWDKQPIIDLAAEIGTAGFAAAMPEYCGVISDRPTISAKRSKVEAEESKFDFGVLEQALEQTQVQNIDEVIEKSVVSFDGVEVVSTPSLDDVVIDIRHPTEEEKKPLFLTNNDILKIPFYELSTKFSALSQDKSYALYCDKGVMSKVQVHHLMEQGAENVKVYQPSK